MKHQNMKSYVEYYCQYISMKAKVYRLLICDPSWENGGSNNRWPAEVSGS